MARWGMVIDLDRCTACQACSFACAVENNAPFCLPEETARGVTMGWREVLSELEGSYPKPLQRFIPRPCMQCLNAPCVKVCPVAATYKRGDGITMQDTTRCIGCRSCMVACPYGVRVFNWFSAEKRFHTAFEEALNPDRPLRPKGVVEKCLFCIHRLERLKRDLEEGEAPQIIYERLKGKYRPGEEVSDEVWSEAVEIVMRYHFEYQATPENFDPKMVAYLPACVQVCPPRANVFGDLNNPKSLVYELAHSHRALRLLGELGTDPSVIYLQEE